MTILKHEMRQGRNTLLIWTAAIGFLLAVCIFLFPEMESEMDEVSDAFSSMGSFSQAFGMDQVSFGTLLGFYSIECGNILGLGGALFAALCAVSMLSKEEKDHTGEFLLTHPVTRRRIVTEKLLAPPHCYRETAGCSFSALPVEHNCLISIPGFCCLDRGRDSMERTAASPSGLFSPSA